MRIGVLGMGKVGGTLAERFRGLGHEVAGSLGRDGGDAAGGAAGGVPRLRRDELVARSEVVFAALPWSAMRGELEAVGDWGGRVLVDCTLPLEGGLRLGLGWNDSGAERVAAWARGARVVKTLGQTGWETMADPGAHEPGRPAMLVAGDDPDARATTLGLVGGLGFEPVDAGPLEVARLLEPYGLLWIHLAMRQGQGRGAAWAITRARP